VHRGHVGDAGGNAGALALELVDEASEVIQAGAFRTPVDDAQDGVAGGEVSTDVDAGRRFDLAFDRGAQRDEARIDDRFGARCLQQRADRQPPDRGQQQQPTSALEARLCLDQNWDACWVRVANGDLPPAGNLAAFASNSCLRRSRRLSGSLVWATPAGAGGSGACLDTAPGKSFLTD
jgi:hypothetical protein